MINKTNIPMLLPERLPKMLPLNGGFRYPASVRCVIVNIIQMLIKITNDVVNDRVLKTILIVFRLFVLSCNFYFTKLANTD